MTADSTIGTKTVTATDAARHWSVDACYFDAIIQIACRLVTTEFRIADIVNRYLCSLRARKIEN